MKSEKLLILALSIATSVCLLSAPLTAAASLQQQEAANIAGTVVSSTRNTMVLRLDDGTYQLFAFDRNSTRPEVIPNGARVQTVSTPGDEPGLRITDTVVVVDAAPPAVQAPTDELPPPIPQFLRELEQDIERQVRRYGVGVRAGVGLDPELVLLGVHAQVGPIFHPDVSVRPNIEFGIGEVTALLALNLEAVYRLPGTLRQGRWSAYVGAGPGFNFTHQNFERFTEEGGEDNRIDFGEFDHSASLNILGGIQYRSGVFIELKSSLYAARASGLRVLFGYNF